VLPKFDLEVRRAGKTGVGLLKLLLQHQQFLVDTLAAVSLGWNNTPLLLRQSGLRLERGSSCMRETQWLGAAHLACLLLLIVVLLHQQSLVQLLQLANVIAIAHLHV
jgi:hypothetical protein